MSQMRDALSQTHVFKSTPSLEKEDEANEGAFRTLMHRDNRCRSREGPKIGHIVLKNLIDSEFSGKLYPINPKSSEILGLKCFGSILEIHGSVDIAVICVPNLYVPEAVENCGRKGCAR